MTMSADQKNGAVLEAMAKLPALTKPSPFYQIGFSGHGVELSFKDIDGANEFVADARAQASIARIEQTAGRLHVRLIPQRPVDVPQHVPDFILLELVCEIIARAMSLKFDIPVIDWNEVAFNAPIGTITVA